MRRYLYIAGAIIIANILIELMRLISIKMSKDNTIREFIEKNRAILILLISVILSVVSFALFELKGASTNTNYIPAEIQNGDIKKGAFKTKNPDDG